VQQPLRLAVLVAALTLALPASAIEINAKNPPPADLHGTYGPKGGCNRSPRVSVDTTGLYIVIGDSRGKVAPLDLCLTCAGGARYEGIERWLSPKVGGGYAAFFRFNADEQRGLLVVEDTGEMAHGPNLKAVVVASPYRKCGPPTQAKPAR
jgi:hypothetical protein